MANIFKYNDASEYQSATNRPAHESSVSYDEAEVHYDAKNPLIPWSSAGVAPVGSILVEDGNSGARFLIPEANFDSASLDPSLQVMDCVLIGTCNGKAVFIHKKSDDSIKWAVNAFYKIECDTSASGGFDVAITINGTAKSGTVAWSEGDTLASIATQLNTILGSGIAVDKNTFIGLSISSYSNSTLTLTNNTGATLTDLTTHCKIDGEAQAETHRTWQAVSVGSLFPTLGFTTASSTNYAENGYSLTAYCGVNFQKFLAYSTTSGKDEFSAESSASMPMKKSVWDALPDDADASHRAVYEKYGGDYNAYISSRMMKLDDTHSNGSDFWSYDNGLEMTRKLASITTEDLDGAYVPAYPAAHKAYERYVSGDADMSQGKWHMPTNHEIAMFMKDENFAKINNAITKIGGGNVLSISGYYWSVAEYDGNYAWLYIGHIGRLNNNGKYSTYSVRSLLALSL